MLTLVSRTMRPDLSDAALSRHFADVAEMAGGEQIGRSLKHSSRWPTCRPRYAMTTFRFWRKRHSENGIAEFTVPVWVLDIMAN